MQLILLITKHLLCVTCGSQWSVKLEEVANSFWRVIPCSQTGFKPIGHDSVYCYLEFKLRYLENLKLFSIRVKELSEPIVL